MTSGQSLVSSPLNTSSPAVAAPTPASSSALAPSEPSQLPIRKPGSYFHLAAGLASGLTSSLLLQPADLLKTRVQQSPTSSIRSVIKTIASTPHPLKQLWRGTLPSAIRTSVGSALYFATLNKVRSTLATSNGRMAGASGSSSLPKLSPGLNLLAGAGARAAVGFIMMPITVVKVRWESSLYQYRSLSAAVKDIVKERGARGLFAGFGATALRDAPYAGLYVVVYEWGKNTLSALSASTTDADQSLKATTSASINFVSGGLAAATATAATNPPDAVKTRLQLMPNKYRNTWQAASLMLKEEGVRSMFDGLGLRMTRKALSSALAWTVYEEFVRRAQKRLYD